VLLAHEDENGRRIRFKEVGVSQENRYVTIILYFILTLFCIKSVASMYLLEVVHVSFEEVVAS
jgi:hypothetical protein